jgi:predicted RNA-binding protein with PUA-like domain
VGAFLVKTEPGEYSFADLVRDQSTRWSGVTNPGALLAVRAIRRGDPVLVYHTGDERAIVGVARAASDPYADPQRPGQTPQGLPRFAVFDLTPEFALRTPVALARIKSDPRFADFALVRQGRLSVMPVPPRLYRAILNMGGMSEN